MQTPVVLISFNRPDLTARVLAQIAEARPPVLYHIQDGPRADRPADAPACRACIALVAQTSWPCDVRRIYAEENMGCGRRVSSGLDIVFSEVETAIILEDDCIADATFFTFCEEVLSRYRDNPSIMHIGGDNFQDRIQRGMASYYFSRYAHIWGWATWRRAWNHFDIEMKDWPQMREQGWLHSVFPDSVEHDYWQNIFDRAHAGALGNVWGYAWLYACLRYGLSVIPAVNLVSNIGEGEMATHTTAAANLNKPRYALPTLVHPSEIVCCEEADRYTFDNHFQGRYRRPGWKRKLYNYVLGLFRSNR